MSPRMIKTLSITIKIMLSVVYAELSVVIEPLMMYAVMLIVVMLNVIRLSVIIVYVVALFLAL
jgi:hypothetical protein